MSQDAGARRGQLVERFLNGVSATPDGEWSAAFIHHVGFWSHFDHFGRVSSWPVPALADPPALGRYADERGVLLADDEPMHGDLFLKYSSVRKAYVRAGIILGVTGRGGRFETGDPFIECSVIEANSDLAGTIGGPSIVNITRQLSIARHDRIVRWVDLDPARAIANPMIPLDTVAGRLVRAAERRAA
jgi:hypothetical protein